MKNKPVCAGIFLLLAGSAFLVSSFIQVSEPTKKLTFPYQQAGLTKRQAAAHLLSRFTYGARPGQVDHVLKTGLEQWFLQQLRADGSDTQVQQQLAAYKSLLLSNAQVAGLYPRPSQVLRQAMAEGVIAQDALPTDSPGTAAQAGRNRQLAAYMFRMGYRPRAALYRELTNQKIIRAVYSPNQLQEVLTSFWFNHFNVSLSKNDCAAFVTGYERDAIRPHVLNKFETLLLATAKSPAMLLYLDNYRSTAENPARGPRHQPPLSRERISGPPTDTVGRGLASSKIRPAQYARGLNENYAREVMELHTLGVDGGYTQRDVTEAARVLTGWTLSPALLAPGRFPPAQQQQPTGSGRPKQNWVADGDFLFAANRHDKEEKTVLGTRFPAHGGYEEGVQLLQMLARHPATARFIATKLAVRFVSDTPPASLVDKMASTFRNHQGDIRQVLLTLVCAPEFWAPEAMRQKIKSPFELAISAIRGLDAQVSAPYALSQWISKMGEKLYYYQAPTGFPDEARYWINTGSLLNRMNFGLALATGQIPGVAVDLAALNQHREPESAQAALLAYSQLLMPERNLDLTVKRLTPMLHDPDFQEKVKAAAKKAQPAHQPSTPDGGPPEDPAEKARNQTAQAREKPGPGANAGNQALLAQVTGIILGSPEFQRR